MRTWHLFRRRFSSSFSRSAAEAEKKFSKSLLLPKTTFPQWCDPQKSELPFRSKTSEKLYRWQESNMRGPLFVMHDGPPYANGNLHIGHAMNKILKDMINRFHLLQGRKVNYIPGWDCHGLPIEQKTLKELKKSAKELPAQSIRQAAKAVAEREIMTQRDEFQQLGIMADWSKEGTYRTLDSSYELRQLRIFKTMVEKGLIYRKHRPVHFSPSSRSALAEAELIYREDHISRSVYVCFRLDDDQLSSTSPLKELCQIEPVKLLVWTTTPWTLTANMAIAVNIDLTYSVLQTTYGKIVVAQDRLTSLTSVLGEYQELFTLRGSDLLGIHYQPIFDASDRARAPYRILASSHVTPDSGTGLVHCAPAHGTEDYAIFMQQGLLRAQDPDSLICHVDDEGKFSDAVVDVVGPRIGDKLRGRDVLVNGTAAIITVLEEMEGVLLREDKFKHKYPYDWKTDKPVIVTATSQWFTNLESIKDDALAALRAVEFYPPESRNRLESFVRSRSEWCISRQRVWGVPIPSLTHMPSSEVVLTTESLCHILSVLEDKGPQHWWDGPVSDFIPPSLTNNKSAQELNATWSKGTDTMDVWFDSGSSWSLLADKGVKSESDELRAYSDICLEGSDQHRGWFQSLLLTSVATQAGDKGLHTLPYRKLITHGMVLDQDNKKMSKSIGNIISPMTVINGGKNKQKEPAYGTDVLRFWVASVEFWRDVALGPKVLSQAAEAMRKIRNSARFIMGNTSNSTASSLPPVSLDEMSIADRYVLRELMLLEKNVFKCYAELNFPRAVQAISRFANITLSSLYFDITKDVLYANDARSLERRAVVTVLEKVLDKMTLMLAPLTPHLAEEIFYHRNGAQGDKFEGLSVFSQRWNLMVNEADIYALDDEVIERDMSFLLKLREVVLGCLEQARTAKNLRSSLEAQVDIVVPQDWLQGGNHASSVIRKHQDFLKTLFIVSRVSVIPSNTFSPSNIWEHFSEIHLPGMEGVRVCVRPSSLEKCPRCWTYTREPAQELCLRCADIPGIHSYIS